MIRALTVRQPWAWAIVHGGKPVENRTRNIAGGYRGPVAIHAGLVLDRAAIADPLITEAVGRLARAGLPGLARVVSRVGDEDHPRNRVTERFGNRGAVIGVVDLVAVHHAGDALECVDWDHGPSEVTGQYLSCSGWALEDHHHLVLANPRPIDPIPAKGRLGLWFPDATLAAQIEEALT